MTDTPVNDLTITIWNANGLAKHTINTATNSLSNSILIFITETWLLSPNRYPTEWTQYHTYGLPVENSYRKSMGICLLIHPDCPYTVTILPTNSPSLLTCQVADIPIHCVYLPPNINNNSTDRTDVLGILFNLPLNTHSSQSKTIICGDINTRHPSLGDTRFNTRGTEIFNWMMDNGIECLNAILA